MRAAGFAALVTLVLTFSPAPLREIRISREEALTLPQEIKDYAGLCDEWIEWRYDLEALPFKERFGADPPPPCP